MAVHLQKYVKKRHLILILFCFSSVVFIPALFRARFHSPEPSLMITDRNGIFLSHLKYSQSEGLGYWPVKSIPPKVEAAFIAVEDRRFYSHPGVDPIGVLRAIIQNIRAGKRVSGASTIAMQVARMQEPGPRTWYRKTVEALSALFLTIRYGRRAVLAQYLALAPFGNQYFGITIAARRYFQKPPEDLSWAESAFLAALPKAPGRMNPCTAKGRRAAIRRARYILRLLLRSHKISPQQLGMSDYQLKHLKIARPLNRPPHAIHAILYLRKYFSKKENRTGLSSPLVKTTIDLQLLEKTARMTRSLVWASSEKNLGNAAVIILDLSDNSILTWVGSADYFDTSRAGAIDFACVPRSTGSTLKPFIYAFAMDKHMLSPASILDDLYRGPGGITNSDDAFLGPLPLRMALGNSRNVPAVRTLKLLGMNDADNLFFRLGLSEEPGSVMEKGLGIAVGGLASTLEHLVRAYTAIAGDGMLSDLKWYTEQPMPKPKRIFSETSSRQITLILSDPLARLPGFYRMGPLEFPFPVAVKTGTSSQYHDAWAVGWSRHYLVGVWTGHPDNLSMKEVTGFNSAAPLMKKIFLYLYRNRSDGLDDGSFPVPRGSAPIKLCGISGKIASDACEPVFSEWLCPDQMPKSHCDIHARVRVNKNSGLPADATTPKSLQVTRSIVFFPQKYAAWAEHAGYDYYLNAYRFSEKGIAPQPLDSGGSNLPTPFTVWNEKLNKKQTRREIRISFPEAEGAFTIDPETPASMATIPFHATVDPPSAQLLWYVDGHPFKIVDFPYSVRWPLSPGRHIVHAEIPFTEIKSGTVRFFVRK